jgi:hypothetical protein
MPEEQNDVEEEEARLTARWRRASATELITVLVILGILFTAVWFLTRG